ncbi:MAG: hypothetical protein HFACDABA_02039 [Anaerolineales bacterium]|nr:hypothetical protein [Anaerolineales bacterium]
METRRILDEYQRRKANRRNALYCYEDLAHLFRTQGRYRATLLLLQARGCHPLTDLQILDVGCGDGNMLRQFLQWGARPENLAGVELRPEPVEYARKLNPNLNIRCASATELPWPDNSMDLVSQHTVFSSILDPEMKSQIASDMLRVLRPSGLILWYDFWLNPTNPQTRGIRPSEIKRLFPGCRYEFHKITLAPPIARRVVPISWVLALVLENLKIFNTHYLAVIQPR